MSVVIELKCPTHPRYKAVRCPKSFCVPCWTMWYVIQDAKDGGVEVTHIYLPYSAPA
jgi:hypothetical protein